MADIVGKLNDLHKSVYKKKEMPNIIPDIAKVQKMVPFSKTEKLGDKYVVGVRLALPSGFTHAVGDGSAGAFALNEVRGGTQKKAEVMGSQIVLRDHMSYEDAAKAVKGERSFVNGVEFFYEGLQLAGRKRIETSCLYGGVGVGTVGVYTAANASYASQPTIQVTLGEWAPQIFAGMEGADLDVMSGATATVRATVQIVGVDIDNRVLILSAAVTGAAANDALYFKGQYGKEMKGIHSILSNTGSLFGIDAAQYGLWKGNQVAVGGAFSFAALKKGISAAVAKGLYGELNLLCSPGAWDNLATNIETLRQTNANDVKKVDVGTEEIEFHSQNGSTKIIAHPMVKQGYAYGLFKPTWKRVGAADFDMGAPGFGGQPWFNLPSNAGVEARMYTNQAVVCETPAQNILFTGIINS